MSPSPRLALLSLGASLLLAAAATAATAQNDGTGRNPLPSPACGTAGVDSAASAQVSLGDDVRLVRVHVPTAHDGSEPLPLIIWLHGQGMSAGDLADVTGLPDFGETKGVVVAAPQGHPPDNGWMWEPGVAEVEPGLANRDIAVVDALIDQLASELCIDLARVYATGYSIGGHGATSLACRLADRVAAVVATSGFTDLGAECDAARTVPMLAMAGMADEYIFFDGGLGDFLSDRLPWGATKGDEPFFDRAEWSLPPVERMEGIALRNGCEPGPASEALGPGVERLAWTCPADAGHVLIVVGPGGHDWLIESGGVDANQLYWDFLSSFSLPT